jgi:PAS domain S-box-containing protein/diguanylate cyclase (GGDEF)-like protein
VPYVTCPACGFRAYTAAGHATVEDCPACGTALPPLGSRRGPGGGSKDTEHAAGPANHLQRDIEARLGRFPAFLEPALANPDVLRELWRQTRKEWLDGPVPGHFRHALLAALATLAPWPWRAVAIESGGASAFGATLDAKALVSTSLSELAAASPPAPLEDWPEDGTAENRELLALSLRLVVDGPEPEVRRRLKAMVGDERYASLVASLTFLETCRMFAQAHPGLTGPEAGYRRSSDPAEVAMVELDTAGSIVSFSRGAERMFGTPAEAVAGKPVQDLFDREYLPQIARLTDALPRAVPQPLTEHRVQVVARRADGTPFEAALTMTNQRRDGRPGGAAVVVDLTSVDERADHAAAAYRVLVGLLAGRVDALPPAAVLDAIAESLGWGCAAVWRFDAADKLLHCVAVRTLGRDVPADAGPRPGDTAKPGEGPVGQVFESGEALWVEELPPDIARGKPVKALRNMTSGAWLSIGPPRAPVGVLEMLSSERRAPDPVLLEMLNGLANSASVLLDRAGEDTVARPSGDALTGGRLAFEGAPVGMALVSLDQASKGVITDANRALSALTGREISDLVGASLGDLIDPDDPDVEADLMNQLLAGRIPSYQVDKRFKRGEDERFWGEMTVSLIRTAEAGRPLYIVVQVADVNERKRADDALHASRERLASVFDEAPIGMAIATLDGRWLQVNPTLCQTLGFEEGELLARTLEDLLHPDEVDTIRRYLDQLFAGDVLGYHVQTRAVRADGELIWIQLSVSLAHDYEGSPAYVLAEVQDLTERKRLEDELERGTLRDDVTGLPSRAILLDRLEQARIHLDRTRAPFAVLFANATGFEKSREAFGHDRSNALLRDVAGRILNAVRPGDTVARYGDADFVIVCEDLESIEEAGTIAGRIMEDGHMLLGEGDSALEVGVRVGVVLVTDPAEAALHLVDRAAVSMQAAKSEGPGFEEYSRSA